MANFIYLRAFFYNILPLCMSIGKVNAVKEACFAVHILKFEILQTTWNPKTKSLMIFVSVFNFNMWTTKHLAQASCNELNH